jgi:hypothetical protein
MDRPLRFSQLSTARQILVRLCQSINYWHIQNLTVEGQEPVLQGASVIATTDIRLEAEDPARGELEVDDFVLCAEVTRLIALFDKVQNATISKIEVRDAPRRYLAWRPSMVRSLRFSPFSPPRRAPALICESIRYEVTS